MRKQKPFLLQLPLERPVKHGLKERVEIFARGGLGGFEGAEIGDESGEFSLKRKQRQRDSNFRIMFK